VEKIPASGEGFDHRWMFQGPSVRIARWRCRHSRTSPGSERAQPVPMIIFMHSGSFRADSSDPIGLLDSTRVGLFNAGVPFRSAHPYGGNDSGSDLAIRPDVLAEILARRDPKSAERPGRPFRRGWGPCDPESFLLHRVVLRKVSASPDRIDALEVEELSLLLADRIVGSAFGDGTARADGGNPRERAEAEALRGLLSEHPGGRHHLDALARRFGSTPFRLCRSFRAATGSTIHRYLTGIRLRCAVDRLADGCRDLTDLAFELGFSSHSHFTATFRRSFGVTPEGVRRLASRGALSPFRERLEPARRAARN
jgi:AraC-like DNA-binding protein